MAHKPQAGRNAARPAIRGTGRGTTPPGQAFGAFALAMTFVAVFLRAL